LRRAAKAEIEFMHGAKDKTFAKFVFLQIDENHIYSQEKRILRTDAAPAAQAHRTRANPARRGTLALLLQYSAALSLAGA